MNGWIYAEAVINQKLQWLVMTIRPSKTLPLKSFEWTGIDYLVKPIPFAQIFNNVPKNNLTLKGWVF